MSDLNDLTFAQACDLLVAAAELVRDAPLPDPLDLDDATRWLDRIREAVRLAGRVDSLIVTELVRGRYGQEVEVEGVGLVKYRRTAKRDRWDERGAAFAVVAAKMEERGGELPDDPAEVVEWLLEAASVGYFRKGALKAMGIDPNDYWHAEKGNPAVDLPIRSDL